MQYFLKLLHNMAERRTDAPRSAQFMGHLKAGVRPEYKMEQYKGQEAYVAASEGYGKIRTDETLRETVPHGSEEYPFQYYLEDIWLFDFHCIDWHWHPEVEFVLIQKGKADFLIGSERHALSAGTGIFINSQVIHRFEAAESTVIPNAVFSPSLLAPEGSLVYRKFIRPVLDSPTECLIISPDVPGNGEVLDALASVFALQDSESVREIKTVELLFRLWRMLYEKVEPAETVSGFRSPARPRAQLQIMMQYVHKNFRQPISLDDLAGTVMLSKSSVLNLFRENLHTSPIEYLINYRLKRAARLLAATEDSVSSVARDSGFENIGYFCRKFKEVFQMTPGEYRKRGGTVPEDSLKNPC